MKIIAKRDTILFKDGAEHQVKQGKHYLVDEVITSPPFVTVVLAYDAGTWYLHPEDWNGLPSFAKRSEIPKPTEHRGGGVNEVVYYSQLDNYRDRDRTCFSSTCAMLLKFYMPDAITNDDQYIKRVFQYGDTTDASTQIKTLVSYGLDVSFSQAKSIDWLKDRVSGKHGHPTAFGWLHHGPRELVSGTGHWSLCYGYDYNTDEFLVHDPWRSDFDHKNGLYRGDRPGESQRFSLDHMTKRWTVEGPNTGWCLYTP